MVQSKKKNSTLSKKNQNSQKNEKTNNIEKGFGMDEQANDTKKSIKANEKAVHKRAANGSDKSAYVSRGTLYFSIAFSIFFGIYLGTLLPSFMGNSQVVNSVVVEQEVSPEVIKEMLELEQRVLKNPKDTAAWISLGNIYFDTHKHEEAISAYEKSLELKPNNSDVLTDLGIMYRSVSNYEKALDSFAKANKVDPRHENSLFNSGVVLYFDLNKKEEGRSKWLELLKINPNAKAPDGSPVSELIKGNF